MNVITESFFLYALFSGILLTFITGPLGCFVVWRKMAYFGDAIAHSALLGVAIAVVLETSHLLSILAVCLSFAFILINLRSHTVLSNDTLLGILAHGALAIGLVTYSIAQGTNANLHDLLFGDILTISEMDILYLAIGVFVCLFMIWKIWPATILNTMSEELAAAEGVNQKYISFILMILMAITVACSIQLIGVLLITALLIIPAAAARQFAKTPGQMAVIAIAIGTLSIIIGLFTSAQVDIPPAPAIVIAAFIFFIISLLKK